MFTTSLEVQVEVYSEETLTGARKLTSRAFLTFVAVKAGACLFRRCSLKRTTNEWCVKKRRNAERNV